MMNQEIMCEVEVGTHGAMVEIGDDDQVGVKVPGITNLRLRGFDGKVI